MRTSTNRLLVLITVACAAVDVPRAFAQNDATTSNSVAERYYDFWPGVWYQVNNGARDSVPTFTVRRSVHPAAFDEEWRLVIDSGRVSRSTGIRAWDSANQKWMFVWVSDLGHFQIWDGVKVGRDWYIQRPFEQSGRRFLSRQAWIPEGADRVLRIMERSFDGGQTWETRSRTIYQRDAAPSR